MSTFSSIKTEDEMIRIMENMVSKFPEKCGCEDVLCMHCPWEEECSDIDEEHENLWESSKIVYARVIKRRNKKKVLDKILSKV